VEFVHGDVRSRGDLDQIGAVDAIVECSAEPSALAGVDGKTGYLVDTNLVGAYNCLEVARTSGAQLIFLSTSRVYPHTLLAGARLEERANRFDLAEQQDIPGLTVRGVSEDFPVRGGRTLYGTTKLAAELLVEEYRATFGLRTIVNRCGVLAGPWQMGKADQGVFTHWALAHWFGLPLSYIGYGGSGKQVRDLLHVEDLARLIEEQLADPDAWDGILVNVGGGVDCSLSLRETTELCRELTGRNLPVSASCEERPGDVPFYASDCSRLFERTTWRPLRAAADIMGDIVAWIAANEQALRALRGI